MSNQTFALDGTPRPAPSTVAPPLPASRPELTLGGSTVLPRVELQGTGPVVVDQERPRFEATGMLGAGGLGEVIAARDLDIGRRVAIKRIRPDRSSQGAFLRFVQEVRTVGRLDHPNIVPIHDVARDPGGQFFFVMKHVEGQTLTQVIEALAAGDPQAHARFSFEQRLDLVKQLMHAVAFAHENGVVHRDLKPDNVLVGAHGEVTLIDFGIAKQVGGIEVADEPESDAPISGAAVTRTRAGQLIGTPRYMAPEQARGEPADERTDVFALCLMLYELLALEHPLDGIDDIDEVLEAVKTRAYPNPAFLPGHPTQGPVPADMGWFVADGLKPDPSDRYPSVQAMLDRLQARANGDIPAQCPVTFQLKLVYRLKQLNRKHPFLLYGSTALVAVGLIALGSLVGSMAGFLVGGVLGWGLG